LTVFFITCSIFGIFQLFLDLDISADSNEDNEYKNSIVGLTVWSGRSFLCFGNFISLTAVLPCPCLPPVTGGCPAVVARMASVVKLALPEILVGEMELREGDTLWSQGEEWGEGQGSDNGRR
jgi:hypothetical protein